MLELTEGKRKAEKKDKKKTKKSSNEKEGTLGRKRKKKSVKMGSNWRKKRMLE